MAKAKFKVTKKGIIILASVVFIVLLVFAGLQETGGWYRTKDDITVDVTSGSGAKQIADALKKNKVIGSATMFYLAARSNTNFKAGYHVFSGEKSYSSIIKELETSPTATGIKIVVPEGFQVKDIAQRLEQNGLCSASDFISACDTDSFSSTTYPFLANIKRTANRLEGYLFPATYYIPQGTSIDDIITMMLNKFNQEFTSDMYARCTQMGYTSDQIITLASIVQSEASGDVDRGDIASVFYNRLKDTKNFGYLQSNVTVQYVTGSKTSFLSTKDTQIDSPYNTYKYPGLPIGPISNPGMASIEATLYPPTTDYYYFVYKNGQTVFSQTYQQHLNAVNGGE